MPIHSPLPQLWTNLRHRVLRHQQAPRLNLQRPLQNLRQHQHLNLIIRGESYPLLSQYTGASPAVGI